MGRGHWFSWGTSEIQDRFSLSPNTLYVSASGSIMINTYLTRCRISLRTSSFISGVHSYAWVLWWWLDPVPSGTRPVPCEPVWPYIRNYVGDPLPGAWLPLEVIPENPVSGRQWRLWVRLIVPYPPSLPVPFPILCHCVAPHKGGMVPVTYHWRMAEPLQFTDQSILGGGGV